MTALHFHLERFEGPLGLLLHLIRKEEMDIFDINIHQITQQYLAYIKAMKQLDLEMAGDFVAMAATLIQIKSRMLLPNYNEDGEVIEGEDPRKELVQKLLEYQKFQDVAKQLYDRTLLGRDVFVRGERLSLEPETEGEILMEEDNALYALILSYRKAIRSMKKSIHKVAGALQSIASRVMEMRHFLVVGQRRRFSELIRLSGPNASAPESREQVTGQVLVTFLSLLELAKMGFVSLFQSDSFAEIHVETKREIDRDVLSQVESYEGVTQAQEEFEFDSPAVVDGASDEDILAEEEKIAAEEASS